MEIAIEYQTSAHQLIEYASSSSNVLLGYLEIDVDVDVAVPENERSSLQPAFDYKKGCPLSRDSDSTCDELESLESSSNFIYVEECNSLNPPEYRRRQRKSIYYKAIFHLHLLLQEEE